MKMLYLEEEVRFSDGSTQGAEGWAYPISDKAKKAGEVPEIHRSKLRWWRAAVVKKT